jgi:hypothetical protein
MVSSSDEASIPLQSGPAHPRHGDVEDQTSGLTDAIGREELFRRRERLDREVELPEQVGQRLAQGPIVVDDRYERAFGHHGFLITWCVSVTPGVQIVPRLPAYFALSGRRGMENENLAPGPSFSAAHRRP